MTSTPTPTTTHIFEVIWTSARDRLFGKTGARWVKNVASESCISDQFSRALSNQAPSSRFSNTFSSRLGACNARSFLRAVPFGGATGLKAIGTGERPVPVASRAGCWTRLENPLRVAKNGAAHGEQLALMTRYFVHGTDTSHLALHRNLGHDVIEGVILRTMSGCPTFSFHTFYFTKFQS